MRMTTEEMVRYPEKVTQEVWLKKLIELGWLECQKEEVLMELQSIVETKMSKGRMRKRVEELWTSLKSS